MENKKILSSITKERKLEIDEILKKTEGDISAGNIKTISLEEFNNNIEKIKENIRNGGKELYLYGRNIKVDLNVGWFIGIKYYIDHNNSIKPLVVSKSGLEVVNTSDSDISFSIDVESGPTRRFLIEKELEWCKIQIAILSCDSKEEVFEKEAGMYWRRKRKGDV